VHLYGRGVYDRLWPEAAVRCNAAICPHSGDEQTRCASDCIVRPLVNGEADVLPRLRVRSNVSLSGDGSMPTARVIYKLSPRLLVRKCAARDYQRIAIVPDDCDGIVGVFNSTNIGPRPRA